MISGISVAVTTFNGLEGLKKGVYSVKKYSVLPSTEISIFVDGSTDGTFEWLQKEGIAHKGRKENIGAFSGWNRAFKNCKNDFVMFGEDDNFFGPQWDLKIAKWIEELGENYVVMPQLVEPILGSYPPIYNCGETARNFDENKFVEYVKLHLNRHEAITGESPGYWTLKKEYFFSVGGLDEFYDPFSRGVLDFQVRYVKAYPETKFVRVWDSMIYHFPPSLRRKLEPEIYPSLKKFGSFEAMHQRNAQYFEKKHGLNVPQAYEFIFGR